jgi:hypothetical protein
MPTADLEPLAIRAGWTVQGDRRAARYAPTEAGWHAVVQILRGSGKGYDRNDRFHVTVIDPIGVSRYSKPSTYLPEAVRLAEAMVKASAWPHVQVLGDMREPGNLEIDCPYGPL